MHRAIKEITLGLISLVLIFFCCTGTAAAMGARSLIQTTDGPKPIEQLTTADRILGLNVSQHQGQIPIAQEISPLDYQSFISINGPSQPFLDPRIKTGPSSQLWLQPKLESQL